MSEFQLIQHYFSQLGASRADVMTGVGDDAAIVQPEPGKQLALALDTLVAGVHFPQNTAAEDIGHKALAVNLSDLAAMGAEPAWATLGLTLPAADESWLAGFSQGFGRLARDYGVQLLGGDTTRGPLTITVQMAGYLPVGTGLSRAGAKPGDYLYVTGTIGDAGLGLKLGLGELGAEIELPADQTAAALERLNRPQPRVKEGMLLRGLASAAIDVSDGLLADLGHVLEASGVGARLDVDRIPLSSSVKGLMDKLGGWSFPLTAGDDYELCFTVPSTKVDQLNRLFRKMGCDCHRIGVIEAEPGLRCVGDEGVPMTIGGQGYDHFSKGASS